MSAVKIWIVDNQLARRNLSNFQRGEAVLVKESIIKEKAKERQGKRNDLSNIVPTLAPSNDTGKTRDSLAKEAGMSHGTLDKIKKIKEQASEETIEKLRSGELSIHKAHEDLRVAHVSNNSGSRIPNAMTWTYDEIVDWLDDIESGALDDFYDEIEIQSVNAFLIGLARAGTSLVDTDDADFLESDIDELLFSDDYLACSPTAFGGGMRVMLCRAWYKQPFKNSKKFFKHHKTLCIAGTAFIVVTAVVIIAVAAAPVAAVAAGVASSAVSKEETCSSPKEVIFEREPVAASKEEK